MPPHPLAGPGRSGGPTICEINKKVGFMLIAKFGAKRGLIVLGKGVPLVGGFIGGAVDGTMTALVGRTTRVMFPVD